MQAVTSNRAGSPARPLIQCSGLGRTYFVGGTEVHALRGVTFDVSCGEFLAVMGPSGSGKSTLANLVGALDRPTAGRLAIDGSDLARLSSIALARLRSRDIGFVFQQFNLLPRMTALENVMLPRLYAPRAGADAAALARARLEEVGLGGRLRHTPAQLSGGQQQRVAIARALVNDPRIILADEPTGALDTKTSREVMEIFVRLNAAGQTLIVITHEPEIAAYAGRLLQFRDGELVSDAAQAPLLARAMQP